MFHPVLAMLSAPPAVDLTHGWAGMAAVVVFILAYLLVMGEEKLQLRKSKPVIVAAGLIWMLVGFMYMRMGDSETAAAALRACAPTRCFLRARQGMRRPRHRHPREGGGLTRLTRAGAACCAGVDQEVCVRFQP